MDVFVHEVVIRKLESNQTWEFGFPALSVCSDWDSDDCPAFLLLSPRLWDLLLQCPALFGLWPEFS